MVDDTDSMAIPIHNHVVDRYDFPGILAHLLVLKEQDVALYLQWCRIWDEKSLLCFFVVVFFLRANGPLVSVILTQKLMLF